MIEILDVSVVENHPYNEEILQKLRAKNTEYIIIKII